MATWRAPKWAPWLLHQCTGLLIGWRVTQKWALLPPPAEGRQRVGGGGGGQGKAKSEFDKHFNYTTECIARHTLVLVSLTQTHRLTHSLTHLVYWYVSHFKSCGPNAHTLCLASFLPTWDARLRCKIRAVVFVESK